MASNEDLICRLRTKKENGDEVEHNVVEREEGASDRYHGGPHNATAGELGGHPETTPRGTWGTIQELDAGRVCDYWATPNAGATIDYTNTISFDRAVLSRTWRKEKCRIDTTTRA